MTVHVDKVSWPAACCSFDVPLGIPSRELGTEGVSIKRVDNAEHQERRYSGRDVGNAWDP